MNSLQRNSQYLIKDEKNEFLNLQTFKDVDNRFKDFQIQHHMIYQIRQDQVVDLEKQKQDQLVKKQPSLKVSSSQTPNFKRNVSLNLQKQPSSIKKEVRKVAASVISNGKKESLMDISPSKRQKKKVIDNLKNKLKKFSQIKDFIWLTQKLANASKKYDFLKDDEICKQFGIEVKKLDLIKDKEQRQDYILNSIAESLKQDICNFESNTRINQKIIEDKEEKLQKQFIKQFNSKKYDILDWVQVKNSQYENLDKKIKLCLIENIHEPQNAEKLREQILHNKTITETGNKKEVKSLQLNVKQYSDIPSQLSNQKDPEGKKEKLKDFNDIFTWNKQREKDFIKNKTEVKSKLYQKIASSNWQYNTSFIQSQFSVIQQGIQIPICNFENIYQKV